jgi:hypothetical protein
LLNISTKIDLTELEFHRCLRIETLMLSGPQADWSDGLKMACLTSQAAIMVGNAGGFSIKYCSERQREEEEEKKNRPRLKSLFDDEKPIELPKVGTPTLLPTAAVKKIEALNNLNRSEDDGKGTRRRARSEYNPAAQPPQPQDDSVRCEDS